MRYDNLPEELKLERAWVNVWNGSKVPMQSLFREAASSTKPETWCGFQAAANAAKYGMYDGIGYVFHNTGLIGIDIDCGFQDGLLTSLAADIISQRYYQRPTKLQTAIST